MDIVRRIGKIVRRKKKAPYKAKLKILIFVVS